MSELESMIRDVPDFPKKGIIFKDITPLLATPQGLAGATEAMAAPFLDRQIDLVVGIESRGFIFGTTVAMALGAGFVPIRKPGKLPAATASASYDLEYGSDSIEIHADAVRKGQRVLMLDDLLATGGTMQAACGLVEKLGGRIVGVSFLIELAFLDGRKKLANHDVHSVIVVSY
ncbi:MAG: Adenine phosphoribosyltransferase [Phycisphaerae bacterium]|nr:Adenine phosphoribosyltransferase [Phycisphaerae bacterium]